jgi:cyanophycinase
MNQILMVLAFFILPLVASGKSLGRLGAANDTLTPTRPGYLLMGGSTDVDAAVADWLARAGGGDIVVLRASGSTGYNAYFLSLGKAHSVETLLIDSKAAALDPAMAVTIEKAEAIFIAGGDQWNYVQFWTGTPVQSALQTAIDKGIPLGGTSAGLAVMGEFVFDARFNSVTSAEALAHPQAENISITQAFLRIPVLQNILTDSHYSQRSRMGRHLVFLTRTKELFGKKAKGLGIDEKTAVVLDQEGKGKVYGLAQVYFLRAPKQKETLQTLYLAVSGSPIGTPIILSKAFRGAKTVCDAAPIQNQSL